MWMGAVAGEETQWVFSRMGLSKELSLTLALAYRTAIVFFRQKYVYCHLRAASFGEVNIYSDNTVAMLALSSLAVCSKLVKEGLSSLEIHSIKLFHHQTCLSWKHWQVQSRGVSNRGHPCAYIEMKPSWISIGYLLSRNEPMDLVCA